MITPLFRGWIFVAAMYTHTAAPSKKPNGHNVFCDHESEYGFTVKNYASLVAEALGIAREDKFKKYKQWGDLKRIMNNVEENATISAMTFSREKIIEVIKEAFNL